MRMASSAGAALHAGVRAANGTGGSRCTPSCGPRSAGVPRATSRLRGIRPAAQPARCSGDRLSCCLPEMDLERAPELRSSAMQEHALVAVGHAENLRDIVGLEPFDVA